MTKSNSTSLWTMACDIWTDQQQKAMTTAYTALTIVHNLQLVTNTN